MVKSGDIDYKLSPEYLIELKMVFEDSPICHVDKELMDHIAKRIERSI